MLTLEQLEKRPVALVERARSSGYARTRARSSTPRAWTRTSRDGTRAFTKSRGRKRLRRRTPSSRQPGRGGEALAPRPVLVSESPLHTSSRLARHLTSLAGHGRQADPRAGAGGAVARGPTVWVAVIRAYRYPGAARLAPRIQSRYARSGSRVRRLCATRSQEPVRGRGGRRQNRAYPSFLLRDEHRGVIRSTALGLTKPEVPNALRILFLWFHPY